MRSLFWCLSLLADPSIEWTGAIQVSIIHSPVVRHSFQSKLGRKKDKFRRKVRKSLTTKAVEEKSSVLTFSIQQENGISREFIVNLNQRASTGCSPRGLIFVAQIEVEKNFQIRMKHLFECKKWNFSTKNDDYPAFLDQKACRFSLISSPTGLALRNSSAKAN